MVDRDRRSDRLRRPALDAHARRLPRAGARPRRPRGGPAAVPAGRARGRLARDRRRLRQGVPAHRPVDELHAGRARVPARQGPAESRRQRRPAQRRATPRPSSHLRNLRDGIRTVVHHPLGFGLGNAGVSASRTGVELKAGESTYTELGVEIGVAGLAVFLAWMAAVLLALWRRSAWLERRVGGDARDRRPDRRDRRPLDRLRALRARRVRRSAAACRTRTTTRRSSPHEGPRRADRPLPRGRAPRRVRARHRGLPHAGLRRHTVGTIACTLGEVVFLAAAAGVFVLARRSDPGRRSATMP